MIDSDLQYWLILIALFWLSLGSFIVWALGFTEFSYLNKNGLRTLYNLFSWAYEGKWKSKNYSSPEITEKLFLQPLKKILTIDSETKMLDLACGTGRMSLMVLRQNWFTGQIKAIDFSEGMLKQFKKSLHKLSSKQQSQIEIIHKDLAVWSTQPTSEQFDVITLMEAGEFLADFAKVVQKAAESLKPSGLLLLTKPPEYMAWLYWGRKQSSKQMKQFLAECGFSKIEIHNWTSRYQVILAWKA